MQIIAKLTSSSETLVRSLNASWRSVSKDGGSASSVWDVVDGDGGALGDGLVGGLLSDGEDMIE